MKVHFEPYVYLAALSHKSALIAWGGFYFRISGMRGAWRLMDDEDLDHVHPPRSSSIGARSAPYGAARVEVHDEGGRLVSCGETRTANHVWVAGLRPDTSYTYRVLVDGREFAAGPRRDWALGASPDEKGLIESGRTYDNRFRTHPHPDTDAPLTFAAIGDFGTGIRRPSNEGRRQREGRRSFLFGQRFFRHPNHQPFLEAAFPASEVERPRWRIPFAHHPPYCAGPRWRNSQSSIEHLVPLYLRAGVRMVLAGHEHNFQHAVVDGVHYIVTGAGGKVRPGRPDGFAQAGTVKWAPAAHFLLARIQGDRAEVAPIGEDGAPLATLDPGDRAVEARTVIAAGPAPAEAGPAAILV